MKKEPVEEMQQVCKKGKENYQSISTMNSQYSTAHVRVSS